MWMNKIMMGHGVKWRYWLRRRTNEQANIVHSRQTIGTYKLCRRMNNGKWLKVKQGPLWQDSLDIQNREFGILTYTTNMFQSFIFSVKSHPLKSDYLQCTTIGFFEQSTYVSLSYICHRGLSQYCLKFITTVYLSIVLHLSQQFISVLS